MARMKAPGGVAAYAVALVLVSILFVFSLVLAILFYTQITAAKQAATEATAKLDRLAGAAEQTQLAEVIKPQGSDTPVKALITEVRTLRQRIVGDPLVSGEDIAKRLADANLKGDGVVLVQEVRRLNAEKEAAEKKLKDTEEQARTARDRLAVIEREHQERIKGFVTAEAKLSEELRTVGDASRKLKDTNDKSLEQLRKELTVSIDKLRDEKKLLEDRIVQANNDKTTFENRLNEVLKQIGSRGIQVDPSEQVDGSVVDLLSEDGLVYIDLGRRNKVPVGITFEVFGRNDRVKVEQKTDIFGNIVYEGGKASIEVISVGENSATCRIVRRTKDQQGKFKQILEGDKIANVVYDPTVTYRFFVFGDFDLNNTGLSTKTDRQIVERMIMEWGGKLSDTLSYDTDFIVLGTEPREPQELSADVVDFTKRAAYAEAKKEYDRYIELRNEARKLAIPVLNQNRFLNLVGYYRR